MAQTLATGTTWGVHIRAVGTPTTWMYEIVGRNQMDGCINPRILGDDTALYKLCRVDANKLGTRQTDAILVPKQPFMATAVELNSPTVVWQRS